jgi:hypothetical protein
MEHDLLADKVNQRRLFLANVLHHLFVYPRLDAFLHQVLHTNRDCVKKSRNHTQGIFSPEKNNRYKN